MGIRGTVVGIGGFREPSRYTLRRIFVAWGVFGVGGRIGRGISSVSRCSRLLLSLFTHQRASAFPAAGRIDPGPGGTYIGRREDHSADRGGPDEDHARRRT